MHIHTLAMHEAVQCSSKAVPSTHHVDLNRGLWICVASGASGVLRCTLIVSSVGGHCVCVYVPIPSAKTCRLLLNVLSSEISPERRRSSALRTDQGVTFGLYTFH